LQNKSETKKGEKKVSLEGGILEAGKKKGKAGDSSLRCNA
jgi:hypothetical protein